MWLRHIMIPQSYYHGYFFNCIKLMSSCKSEPSQPQLLSPKFFEQPPKLLPPSIFRQACCELEAASNDEHAGSRSAIDESTSKPFWSQHEVARDREGALARSQTSGDYSEPTRKLRSADINETPVKSEKYIQQHHSQSISKKRRLCPAEPKTDQETFNPKYDNQLLLVAENVSYTLAAKQRWKESNHLAVVSGTTASEGKRLDKVLQYTGANVSASTKGQLALELGDRPKVDTPTCVVSVAVHVPAASFSESTISTSTKTLSCPCSADSKPTKRPVTESVSSKKDLRGSHDIGVNVPTSSKTSKASFIVRDRTLCPRSTHEPQVTISYSLPVCSVLPGADRSTRNNFNEVDRGFAGEQCLKPRHEKSPPTELNTSSQKPEIPRYHPDLKTKASRPPVAVGERNSTSSVPRMATAIDTDSDLVLAQVLQSEEYEASGECVVRKKERTKPQRVAADCSRDFEIARRLQQELDAESAQSMQSQHHDYRRMPGLGRKLGSGDATRRNDSEDVEVYRDNNNQYRYAIRENFTEHPGASVGYGGGARGISLPRSHHRYRGATAATFSGEEIDMTYETLVELEDVSRGLDKATISRLSNTYKYNPSMASSMDKSCLVCLSEFESGEMLRSLPCIHAFHESCIDKWLTDNRQCPVCMKDIDSMQS